MSDEKLAALFGWIQTASECDVMAFYVGFHFGTRLHPGSAYNSDGLGVLSAIGKRLSGFDIDEFLASNIAKKHANNP